MNPYGHPHGRTRSCAPLASRALGVLLCLSSTVSFAEPPAGAPVGSSVEETVAPLPPVPVDALEQPRLLAEALARYRRIEAEGGWGKVPSGLVMGPGFTYDCARIAAVEKRLLAEGYLDELTPPPPPPPPPVEEEGGRRAKKAEPAPPPPPGPAPIGTWGPCEYGPKLTAAMRAFQADRKVLGIGQLGGRTVTELDRPASEIADILEQDLERWRRVSLEPSGTFLLVNIPFFELIAYERGREVMRMPVVVGLPGWPTPLLHDELEYLVVNPDWGIPEKIAKQEYWPSAKRDPKWLSRQGITATGSSLRQAPGPNNPLGRIKFVMPNEHDVYLHDTPAKRAFDAAVRALSHGCVRLGRPMDLANHLLRDDAEWTPKRLQAAISSGRTAHIPLKRRMPVHIVYSTSRVNEEGRVELRPDVYRRNRRVVTEEAGMPSKDAGREL